MMNFQLQTFDINQLGGALTLAKMAQLIYETPDDVKMQLKNEYAAHEVYCENHSNDMQCALARFDEGLILIFKGTKEPQDWLVNVDTQKVAGPWGGRVHRGFYRALLGVWPMLNAVLKEMQTSSLQPLWITGHSLGGALATLAAAQFWVEKRKVSAVYTFGAPRVGDHIFCQAYDERIPHTVRFVHNEDLVPRVPKFRYAHVGDKCYFDRDKSLLWNPSKSTTMIDWMEEINFRSMKVSDVDIRRHPGGIDDHAMQGYVTCLEKNLGHSGASTSYSAFENYINV